MSEDRQHFLTVRVPRQSFKDFSELVAREERTVSQDIRLYIQKRLDRADRERARREAA